MHPLKKVMVMVFILSVMVAALPVQAQGTVEDQVFAIVAQNLGLFPAPTKGQLDLGTYESLFAWSYRSHGLDLNPSRGQVACDARVMGDDEVVVGWFGFRILVTVGGLRYEFRTNGSGSQIIRCSGGNEVSTAFGAPASKGAVRSGWDVTDDAMRHLSRYLELETVITREAVDAAYQEFRETGEFDYPYGVGYRWDSVMYSNSALNCPASGQTYSNGTAPGVRIILTVDGRSYQYRASPDGAVLILCLSGRADPSSTGVTIPTTDS